MAVGLQIWNSGGGLIFDTNDRVGRVVGTLYTGGSNGSIYNAEVASGQGFAIPYAVGSFNTDPYSGSLLCLPSVRVDGGTISWDYSQPSGWGTYNCLIVYGVY